MKMKKLTPEEERVMVHGETEAPFTGKYLKHSGKGMYMCRRCGSPLFRSDAKFDSGTGWPSFDKEIKGAVKRIQQPDKKDGRRLMTPSVQKRTEIRCARCGAHLGHIFVGEGFTQKSTRHCVNSVCLDFEPHSGKKVRK